jgi:hypothetical protein
VAKFGSQHGVGRKGDHDRDATSQRDPDRGEQELFTETSHAILARWAARTGWDFRDGHHVSGVLNHWIASRQLTEAAKGGDMDDVIVSLRLVLQLERVPCLPP